MNESHGSVGGTPVICEALIFASVEADLRELALPEGLAARVIARADRRRLRLPRPLPKRGPRVRSRVHFMVGAAVATAVATAVAVPLFGSHSGVAPAPMISGVPLGSAGPLTFDPARVVTFGSLPAGWRQGDGTAGLFQEQTAPADVAAGVRRWSAAFGRPGDRGRLTVSVAAGRITFAQVRPVGQPFASLPVPVGQAESFAAGGVVVVVWQPRTGVVFTLRSAGLPAAEVVKVVRGIGIAG